jgi:S-layer homology domain
MFNLSQKTLLSAIGVTIGLTTGATVAFLQPSATASAPSTSRFSDTQGYWAQPFIQSLVEQNIVAGYPDGTFRPNQPMARDEFAAIVRSAFNQPIEREISSGGVYKDVPENYWAVPAIKEAYEMGFVQGYPDGSFRPQQPITKASAVSTLAHNLNLPGATGTIASQPPASPAASPTAPANSTNAQPARSPASKRRVSMYPMAITMLMQPLVNQVAPIASVAQASQPTASPTPVPAAASPTSTAPSPSVTQYYEDADQIPQEAIADVAAATRAGIVVNYPNPRLLNPNQPASRGEVAALIHQALVTQGRTTPIADNPAANYIVKP